jgi:hypothetical protein
MHRMQNAETINRLVIQGEILLKSLDPEYKKDPVGRETEFLCGKTCGMARYFAHFVPRLRRRNR